MTDETEKVAFGRALEMLKRGAVIRRASWPAENWLLLLQYMIPLLNLKSPYGRAILTMAKTKPASHIEVAARIDQHTDDGMQPGWLPTCADLLATDWQGFTVEYSKKGWMELDENYISNFKEGGARS